MPPGIGSENIEKRLRANTACQLEITCILPLNGTSPLQGPHEGILSVAPFSNRVFFNQLTPLARISQTGGGALSRAQPPVGEHTPLNASFNT
jgi:hypothetical protein